MSLIFNPADYPTRVQRTGVPFTKPVQIHLLRWLHDPSSRPTEQPFKRVDFQALGLTPHANASLRSLIARDWIIASTKTFDFTCYQITTRGIKALKIINQSTRKQYANDLCSRCQTRPRKQYPSRLHTYCQECMDANRKRTRQIKGHRHDPKKPCSRCRHAPRRISHSGKVYVYCAECVRVMSRESYYRNRGKEASHE